MVASGGSPIVGGMATFATDSRISDMTAFVQNVLADDSSFPAALFGADGLSQQTINRRQTMSVFPLQLQEVGWFSKGDPISAGRIVVYAEMRTSLFRDTLTNGIPDFARELNLRTEPVQVRDAGGVLTTQTLLRALEQQGFSIDDTRLNESDLISSKLKHLCNKIDTAISNLKLSYYDRLAVKQAMMREIPAWDGDAKQKSRLDASSVSCFSKEDRITIREMGLAPNATWTF